MTRSRSPGKRCPVVDINKWALSVLLLLGNQTKTHRQLILEKALALNSDQ